jgi:hypothetical protein
MKQYKSAEVKTLVSQKICYKILSFQHANSLIFVIPLSFFKTPNYSLRQMLISAHSNDIYFSENFKLMALCLIYWLACDR